MLPSRRAILHQLRTHIATQRSISAILFLHRQRPIFYLFSEQARHLTMSLRRSARVSASSSSSTPTAPIPNGATSTTTTQTSKAPPARKRKSRASGPASKTTTATTSKDAPQAEDSSRPFFQGPPSTTTTTTTTGAAAAAAAPADFAVPTTPVPKKRRKAATSSTEDSPIKPPPFTPTPSAIGLIAHSSGVGAAAGAGATGATVKKSKTKSSKSNARPQPPSGTGATAIGSGSGSRGGKDAESSHPLEDLPDLFKARPAEPHATNAPLATPGGSRVVAYALSPVAGSSQGVLGDGQGDERAEAEGEESPTKQKKKRGKVVVAPPDVGQAGGRSSLLPPTSTVETLLKEACEHLCKVDPGLKGLVDKHHCKMFSPEGLSEVVDPFTALSSGIMGQQVSGQAAASIRRKFTALFPTTHPAFPSPSQVLEKDLPTLRTAGLSQRKAEYITGLAEKFASGELSAQMLVNASDEDLIEKLVAVRGLGRWSVEMFACFGLKRMDVFSTGDLGVQRGMATYVGKDVSKLKNKGGKWKYMSENDMLDVAAKFSPYRSLFMWYMWRIEDVDISVMQST